MPDSNINWSLAMTDVVKMLERIAYALEGIERCLNSQQ